MSKNIVSFSKDILGILFGTAICGIGFSLFLIPYKSSPGGVGGLAQILYYMFDFSAGLSMLVFNIPLFLIGVYSFGKTFGLKTVIAMFSLSFFTDLFSAKVLLNFQFMQDFLFKINETEYSFTNETILAVLTGSLIVGAGFGIVIKFNGSTGGTDIPALLMRKHFGITIGNSYLIIDTFVITLVGLVFKNPNLILWGMISLYLSSKMCDFILEGYSQAKGVMIITKNPDIVKALVLEKFQRGCTILDGRGGYTDDRKEIVYTVINQRELIKLKSELKEFDNEAFVNVLNVHEALGAGFKKF
ncbi:MAG: YitT family protein [Candidatus Delongbacteria bacterium]|nr:YitT family protein [Candidatus Delongbacteria bacterium]MBN2836329.1 YitT family protein [Candidatus Delongbacteria bacterium]